jgi:hypothetical protein
VVGREGQLHQPPGARVTHLVRREAGHSRAYRDDAGLRYIRADFDHPLRWKELDERRVGARLIYTQDVDFRETMKLAPEEWYE